VRAGLDELTGLFLELLRIPSPSGEEGEVAGAVKRFATGAGLDWAEDDSAVRTGLGSGNLIVRVPGRGEGTPVALCAHMDTVPLPHAPNVVVEDGVVRSDGETILGADDKAAVAALLCLARDLAREQPAADVEVVITAGEEIGLQGAKALDLSRLQAAVAFVIDSEGPPGTIVASAPTLKAVDAVFNGVAAHAGMDPEAGRSAVVAAARAVAALRLGRIDDETTANVGVVRGGTAVNVVPERCEVRAEVRSRDPAKAAARAEAMIAAFNLAAAEVGVDVQVDVSEAFRGYAHEAGSPALRMAAAAIAQAGLEPRLVDGGGGSDGNVFNARGLPAVTLGAGFERVHSPQERMALERLGQVYELVHALVRVAGATAREE
jgi:tripeptide aminopeptidase